MSTDIALLNQEIMELKRMVNTEKTNRLNDSLFSKGLAPHYTQLALQLSKSSLVPKAYQGKPQDMFIAMALGYQIGLSVEQAIQAIAVINGKPCLWGDDMLALCMAHPEFEDIIEEPIGTDLITGYRCTVKRKGKSDHSTEFTLNMAKKAGLLSKVGPWTQYPERMLQLRARAFCLRDRFPDALKGIKSREEVEDYIEAEYKIVDDKTSRTEFLKRDILTKKGTSYDAEINSETSDLDSCAENKIDTAQTDEDKKSDEMVETGTSEVNAHHSDNSISQITPLQLETIKRLIDEKGFNEERVTKAMHYYEAAGIEDLATDLADHFIMQLNKA